MSGADIPRGTRVVIPEGCAIVSDMSPGVTAADRVARRTHVVRVDHTSSGMRGAYREPTVRWAGSGGYWREAFLQDVEVVDEAI